MPLFTLRRPSKPVVEVVESAIGDQTVSDEVSRIAKLYSVPRRFDLATVMVVIFAYALLLGGLRLLQLPPLAMLNVAGFVTCVAIAQAALFRGKTPRLASKLVGAVYLLAAYLIPAASRDPGLLRLEPLVFLVWVLLAAAGAFVGYLAGLAVASVFLLSDVVRRWLRRPE